MKGLGRLYSPDIRDKNYPLTAKPLGKVQRTWQYWYSSDVMDQGSTPHCVAYAGIKWLKAGPIRNLGLDMQPVQLYNECQLVDEWPGTDYDGTSVRALFKILKSKGYVPEYRWTWDIDTLASYVLESGPMVVGTTWYSDMYFPNEKGFIKPGGSIDGGHAYTIIGVNLKKGFRILNSWGEDWGQNGRAWMDFSDMEALLKDQGEACVATETLNPLNT